MATYDGSEEKVKDPLFPSSSLAALFDNGKSNSTSLTSKDISLSYTAPKQPKSMLHPDLGSQGKTTNTIVFCAKTVKLIKASQSRITEGDSRVGIALIGNENFHIYQLILYKNKQNVINRIKVTSSFIFNIYCNKTASFKDENNILLRTEFQHEIDLNDFVKNVKLKGGQVIINQNENLTVENFEKDLEKETFLLSDDESNLRLKSDIDRLESVQQIPTTTNIETSSNITYTQANIDTSLSNVSNVIANESKVLPNFRNRLSHEPFNYLSRNSSGLHQTRQQDLLPFPYQGKASASVPIHDVNYTAYSQSNNSTFMADNLNSFMTESRAQSCEMRMHLLQLSTKLDALLRDVSDVNKAQIISNRDRTSEPVNYKNINVDHELELNNLTHENLRLRKQLDDNTQQGENTSKCLEENCRLKLDLQNKNTDLQKKLVIIEDLKQEVNDVIVKGQHTDALNTENCINLQQKFDNMSKTLKIQQLKINEFECFNAQCEQEKNIRNESSKELKLNLDATIKETMNKLYQSILNSFDDTSKYDVQQIEQIVGRYLRTASNELVQNVSDQVL